MEQDVFLKTHELWSEGPAIYVVRDPRDVYCSYATYESHMQNRIATVAELIQRDSWSKHVESWANQDEVHLIKYEDLLTKPVQIMKDACSRFGVEAVEIGKLPDWNSLAAGCRWYYQQGKPGRWKTELTASEADYCLKENGESMLRFGYY